MKISDRLEALRAAGGETKTTAFSRNGIEVIRHETIVKTYVRENGRNTGGLLPRPSLRWELYVDGKFNVSSRAKSIAMLRAERMATKRDPE
jgi:hypothetical protein